MPVSLLADPAAAAVKQPGQHYASLGTLDTVLLFVVTPLTIFLVVAGLAALPSTLLARRAKRSAAQDQDPVWIGVPVHTALPPQTRAVTASLDVPATDAVPLLADCPDESRQLVGAGAAADATARGGASASW
jgi:hypothetical protein